MMNVMKQFMNTEGPGETTFRQEVSPDFVTGTVVEWTLPWAMHLKHFERDATSQMGLVHLSSLAKEREIWMD